MADETEKKIMLRRIDLQGVMHLKYDLFTINKREK